ncbi:hypothetical protein CBER1_11492 [Cercospora berteroae]|uniref:Uncharacterized protein n=1 Tax=Cercospora berteroae TaxID=357750 RepID=A0A2S6BZM2_9PEZI|nr:hypothetical protein CBER1_11492 [Cercospora berteroae]
MAITRHKAARDSKSRASSSTNSKPAPVIQSRASSSNTSKSAPVGGEPAKALKNPAACLSGIAAELRSEIFKLVFARVEPLKLYQSGDKFVMMSRQHHGLQPGILGLCKTFLHEAAPALYGETTISIASRHVPEFLESIGEANAKLLRRFRVFPDRDLSWALKPILRCPRLKEVQFVSNMVKASSLIILIQRSLEARGLGSLIKPITNAFKKMKGGPKRPADIVPDLKNHFKVSHDGYGTATIERWGTKLRPENAAS